MSLVPSILLATLAVLPSDRMAMADRLFNRGRYAEARQEYAALEGAKDIPGDELLYRLAECDRALGKDSEARGSYRRLVEKFPSSRHIDRSRLMGALSAPEAERKLELEALDSDRVEKTVRAAALYHLGTQLKDPVRLARSVKVDPKGRYAAYASFHRAAILSDSPDAKDRREAVASLLSIAFGGESEFAEEALYLAAVKCYTEKRYGESSSLLHRHMKRYPKGKRFDEVRSMCAWSDYLGGKYSDALAICSNGETDDFSYIRAACAYASGDVGAAKKFFEKYLEDYPQGRNRVNAELPLLRIGFDEAEKAGQGARAVECAKRSFALSRSAGDRLRLAWAYEKTGMAAEAVREYEALVKETPGSAEAAEALYRKAMIDLRAERWAAADMALAEALAGGKTGRRRALALYWRGIAALRLGHEAEGAERLTEALDASLPLDESREARLMLADIDLRKGRVAEAKSAYAKLVEEGACSRMSAAKILAVGKLLDGEGAKICASALIRNDSAEWRQAGFALLGKSEEASGSYTAAVAAYRSAMAEKAKVEDVADAALRLGKLELKGGEYEKAEKTLKKAVELNSSDTRRRAEAYVALAQTALAKGDKKAARGYATVVTALFDDEEFCAEAGKILEKTK
ncbi:MAG: tetratricopeptide repeat protein [Kiritimatiellae bacterium]|nr:tetratricopeptide repeat protein [Kiritimatiellia bacterium]